MLGRIDECILVSLRTPAAAVCHLVPPPLELITAGGFAFWNIVICHIDRMRPRACPRFLGLSYHHAASRLLVRARTAAGDVEGLWFLRSDADHPLIIGPGNLASDFRFHPARIAIAARGETLDTTVSSRDGRADMRMTIDVATPPAAPTDGSPFATIDDARRTLKYQPLGLVPNPSATRLRLAEVIRDDTDWSETSVTVTDSTLTLFDTLGVPQPIVELATRIAPIDYRWRLGRTLRI